MQILTVAAMWNTRSWIYPAIAALVCVLAAEAVAIAVLVRRMLAASRLKKATERNEGTSLSGFAALAMSGGVMWASEVWLIVLGVLALVGATALAVLFLICRVKGYLFVPLERAKQAETEAKAEATAEPIAEVEAIPTFSSAPEDADLAMEAFSAEEAPVPGDGSAEAMPRVVETTVTETVRETVRKKAAAEPPADDDADEPDDLADDDGDDDGDSELDDPDRFTGNERIIGFDDASGCYIVARYRKSFEAKLIQSQSHIKKYYSEIKNALLAYKGSKSRMSWTADSFHNGRAQIAKINVKTRILELYLALDPATLEGSVYRGQDVGALKKYEETPFRYKIRTPRKFRWALELVRRVCEEHGLSPIDIEPVDYEKQYPFDTIDHLVERKLVKVTTRLEKPPTTFELDEDRVPDRQADENIPSEMNVSFEYDDDPAAEPTANPATESETVRETVRITQIRYTERYGENGEPISVTDRVVTDAPADAVTEEPAESAEPTAEAAFAPIEENGEADPLAVAFGEAHPENLWSEETTESEAARMNGEIPDEARQDFDFPVPDFEDEPAPAEAEEPYTEELLSVEESESGEERLASLFDRDDDDEEPTEGYGVPNEPADADGERGIPADGAEEPAYADPQFEEVSVEDLPQPEPQPEPQAATAPQYGQYGQYEQYGQYSQPSYATDERPRQTAAEAPRSGAAQSPKKKQVDPDLALVDVTLLDINFEDGDLVTLEILQRRGLVLPSASRLKVRATGGMRHALTVVANQFTYDAILAIGEAGGETQFIR